LFSKKDWILIHPQKHAVFVVNERRALLFIRLTRLFFHEWKEGIVMNTTKDWRFLYSLEKKTKESFLLNKRKKNVLHQRNQSIFSTNQGEKSVSSRKTGCIAIK
jgi:hypothetical protein